jgi:spore coat polysaccharide biosynthesis protein SpsF (cytidylyltransferase family)
MNQDSKKHVVRITNDNPTLLRAIVEGIHAANKVKKEREESRASATEKGA